MKRFILALAFTITSFNASAGETEYARLAESLVIPENMKQYKILHEELVLAESQSIEQLFKLGEEAKTEFLESNTNFDPSKDIINKIVWSDIPGVREEFEENMANLVPGYDIEQGAENFYYELNSDYYLTFAIQHGNDLDKKFFALHKKYFPHGETWPAYTEQQTDITACVKYGSAEFIDFYNDWNRFIEENPNTYYAEAAKGYIEIYKNWLSSRCSCDDKTTTIKSLKNLEKITKNLDLKTLIRTDIDARTDAPNVPASSPSGYYGYNAELCGS